MIRVGVIGYGYWGPNLVRNFWESPGTDLKAVSDMSAARLESAHARYPAVRMTTDYRDLLEAPDIDAIAIATPVSTHFDLAMAALRAGKHVLIEKPMCETSEQAERLIEEAARRRLTVFVEHTFVYTGAVRKISELARSGTLGDIYYYDSVRVNLGLFQRDVNVVWDLAVHDLAIMDAVLPEKPVAVSASGISHFPGSHEDVAYLTLFFDSPMIAHVHVNWLSPVKIRRTLLGGSRQMVVYDDLEPSEKVRIYDRGVTLNEGAADVYQMLVGYRTGDMWAPQVGVTEALATSVGHFAESISAGTVPETDGEAGLRVVRILEAASQSIADRGRVVDLARR